MLSTINNFTIKEAYYGERGNRRQIACFDSNGICEEKTLDINENPDSDERQIYIDGKLTLIKDIIYSFIDF